MTFAHSLGQDFYNDLLNYTNENSLNNNNSIETSYELQKRLADFWKNNGLPTLVKSQKYSGETSLYNKSEPLGGPINLTEEHNTDEFPFWSMKDTSHKSNTNETIKTSKSIDNRNETSKSIDNNYQKENFTPVEVKEEFNEEGGNIIFIIVMIFIILLLISTLFVLSKK